MQIRVIIAALIGIMLFVTAAVAGEPYLGLSVRDADRGPVVGWVLPGPFGGTGFDSSSGIRRSDLLVRLNGRSITSADEFTSAVSDLVPGEEVTIVVRRAPDAVHRGAVPDPGSIDDEATRTIEFTVTVADRDQWTGTVGRAADGAAEVHTPSAGEFEQMILDAAETHGIRDAEGGLDALLAHLAERQQRDLDPNSLPVIVQAFHYPLQLDVITRSIAEHARIAARGEVDAITALISHVLDVPFIAPDVGGRPHEDAWSPIVDGLPDGYMADARRLVRRMRDSVYIYDADAESHIGVIRRSPEIVERAVRRSLEAMPVWHAWVERVGQAHAAGQPIADEALPDAVRDAVTGDVLHYELDAGGRVLLIVGGSTSNKYDMQRIACVYDVGGDNSYRFGPQGPFIQVIIDIEGNDQYLADGDFCGPGVGVFGFSIVDDRDGDDLYRSSGQFTISAGLFGMGVIVDHGGNDRYENIGPASGWSTGAGFYGAGVVVSRAGNDVFLGEQLVQGVGGPRGFGAIINAAGNDLYRANGPNFPSVYGTPGVFATKGQGFGYGVRGYAAGGIGAIYDLGGNDRYEGGEFAQAGGYYFGMGIIHDFAGDDLYYGNRYGQAFAAHQAVGLLIDDSGNDTFWSMTAASQSGAWDESITMLLCRGGMNTFRCDGLGQAAAAHQSIALLIAPDGANHYVGRGGSVQGHSGSNEYHFRATGVFSFSGFFDLTGSSVFSSGRSGPQATGFRNETDPAGSRLHGLFVDR